MDAVLSVRQLSRLLNSTIATTVLLFLMLSSSTAGAADIWMMGAPKVSVHTPGWENVRADTGDMWKPDAPWKTVAGSVRVIQMPPGTIERSKDSDLQLAWADIKRRNMALAVGTGLLIRSDRCRSKAEAYVDQNTLENLLEKMHRTGADLKYVTMDEPFFYGHRDSGPTSCHESPEALAKALKESIAIVRKYFPNAQIGADEVVDDSRPWVQELAQWTETYKAVTGEPLAYIHTDLTWTEAAVRNLAPLAAALKQHHIPLGVIYDADLSGNKSDAAWTRSTVRDFARVEQELGVRPDHAVIESWVKVPTHMLPENEPGTLTNVVLQYIQKHPH